MSSLLTVSLSANFFLSISLRLLFSITCLFMAPSLSSSLSVFIYLSVSLLNSFTLSLSLPLFSPFSICLYLFLPPSSFIFISISLTFSSLSPSSLLKATTPHHNFHLPKQNKKRLGIFSGDRELGRVC